MNRKFLPGITTIGYCKSANLQPDVLDVIDTDKKIKVYGLFTDIPMVGNGQMSIKSELVKGVTYYTTNIIFQILAADDEAKTICSILEQNNNSFRLTNINGDKMLVGTHEKPFAVISASYQNGNSIHEVKGYFVEIIYKNTHSFLFLE